MRRFDANQSGRMSSYPYWTPLNRGPMVKHILIPTDGAKLSLRAVRAACDVLVVPAGAHR